jgi:PIN domain nuclease of toxin-antitoxin system
MNPPKGDDILTFDEFLIDEGGPEYARKVLGHAPEDRARYVEMPDGRVEQVSNPSNEPGPVRSAVVTKALDLPFVASAIKRVQSSPKFKDMAPDDHKVLDQVYKEIGEDIRVLQAKRKANNLGTAERRELADLIDQRTQLKDAITSRAPSYGRALESYSGDMAMKDAYVSGSKPSPADMIQAEMGELSGSEAKMFKEGKAQTLRANVPNADLGEFARFSDVLAPVASREKAEVFKATFGPDAYQEYLTDLIEMAKMQKMRAGAGESTTVDKLLEQLQVSNPDIMDVVGMLAGGGMNPRNLASKALNMVGVDKLLASKKNAATNASFLLRSGEDIPRTLDEMVRMRSLAETPRHPLLFKNDNRPTLDQVKNTTAREAGAVVGRRKRSQ